MTFSNFEEIVAWQKGKELVKLVYELTKKSPFSKDFGLIDQVRRAAISIPSNIAEGFDRQTNNEFRQFLFIAKGSTAELRTQISIAHDLGYISEEECKQVYDLSVQISKMLTKLTQYLTVR